MHPILALYRRNDWATRQLLHWCSWQRPEVLTTGAEDVQGSIEGMFNHILGAEGRYLRLLTGELPRESPNERSPLPVADLQEPAERLAGAWRELLGADRDVEGLREHERAGGRTEMPDWIPLVQAFHHGDDHRTQVGELLLRAGVMVPELDVWMFGFSNPDPADLGPPFADILLRRAFGHHLWATQKLLERCARLTSEELAFSAPGAFGTILDTCGHLVASDRGYWKRLVAQGPGGKLEDESLPGMLDEWRRQQARWGAYLESGPDFEARVETSDGRYPAWVLAAQAVHHGNDHRAHLGTVLLHHGLEAPDVDVWSYGVAEGVLREIA